jgi:hypothetical protein
MLTQGGIHGTRFLFFVHSLFSLNPYGLHYSRCIMARITLPRMPLQLDYKNENMYRIIATWLSELSALFIKNKLYHFAAFPIAYSSITSHIGEQLRTTRVNNSYGVMRSYFISYCTFKFFIYYSESLRGWIVHKDDVPKCWRMAFDHAKATKDGYFLQDLLAGITCHIAHDLQTKFSKEQIAETHLRNGTTKLENGLLNMLIAFRRKLHASWADYHHS